MAAYLGAGTAVFQSFGLSWCRFGCGNFGSRQLSDGLWLWPDGLVHYVRTHRVALPREFVQYVQEKRVPASLGESESRHVDESTWLAWAADLATVARTGRLQRAEAELTSKIAAIIDPEIERLERVVAVGERSCATEGCTRLRLRSGPMCSRCFALGMARNLPRA